MTNVKSFDLTAFDNLGNEAIKATATSKQSKNESQGFQASFSWMTLQILLSGKLQDAQHVANVFAKEGKFHSVRMIYSRARAVAKELTNNQSITVSTKKESFVFTLEETINSPSMLFNVSTAYNSIKKAVEENEETTDEKAIKAYLEASGMSKKDFNAIAAINPQAMTDAIHQGKAILAELETKAQAEKVPALCEDIRAQFVTLSHADEKAAYGLLQSLIDLYQGDTAIAA